MTLRELKAQVALGEDSRRQFKRDVTNPDALAAEMAAFANSDGGSIFLGVADDGSMPGLSRADVARPNQMIGNVAAQHYPQSADRPHPKRLGTQKSSQKIVDFTQGEPTITIADLARRIGVTDRAVKKQIEKLKALGRIRRIGPDKGGHWEIVE